MKQLTLRPQRNLFAAFLNAYRYDAVLRNRKIKELLAIATPVRRLPSLLGHLIPAPAARKLRKVDFILPRLVRAVGQTFAIWRECRIQVQELRFHQAKRLPPTKERKNPDGPIRRSRWSPPIRQIA